MSDNTSIENVILCNLQYNADYTRKVIPFLKKEYFSNPIERLYFERIEDFFKKYNALPTKDAISIDLQSQKVPQSIFDEAIKLAKEYELTNKKQVQDMAWLLENTERFCKDRSLYNALIEAVSISNGENKKLSTTAIPDILSKALSVSFDTNIGHDYISNADDRYDYYTRKVAKIPFHLDSFNKITGGGAERKTVNVIAAGTGVGKSMFMCDLSANYIKQGFNVLYITLEMAEEKIAQRIDANLMNLNISDVPELSKIMWDDRINTIKTKCLGKLKVKEYPTGSANVGHFRFLLRELKQKQNFIPDVIMVDYLNICGSALVKNKNDLYTYVKSVSEELRGFAVENNIILWTATQLNRDGIDNSDADLKNISESMGGPHTFDLLFALISTEDLAKLGQVLVKQLKNRYGDLFFNNKFNIGIDRAKMKFYDLNIGATSIVAQPKQTSSSPKPIFTNNGKNGNTSQPTRPQKEFKK